MKCHNCGLKARYMYVYEWPEKEAETKMTNEEKIRSMSREELAEFLAVVDVNQPEYCKNAGNQFCSGQLCVDCAMKWLGEEAKEHGNQPLF